MAIETFDDNFIDLNEQPEWADKVHGFALGSWVQGGANGVDNVPIKELANRTVFLKKEVDKLNEVVEAGEDSGDIDLEAIVNAVIERRYPVGSSYIQAMNDPDPIEAGLPGQWKTGLAVGYRVTSAALPTYTPYQQGMNLTANQYVSWHLPGASHELWKAKAAITGASEQLDPVLFEKFVEGDIVERRHLQAWIDDDFALGDTIPDGEHAGKRVVEVISLGGTFPSYEGGNRPPFLTGGIAGDVQRPIIGDPTTGVTFDNTSPFVSTDRNVFFLSSYAYQNIPGNSTQTRFRAGFDIGRQVPVGPEGSNRTATWREWRRVA